MSVKIIKILLIIMHSQCIDIIGILYDRPTNATSAILLHNVETTVYTLRFITRRLASQRILMRGRARYLTPHFSNININIHAICEKMANIG